MESQDRGPCLNPLLAAGFDDLLMAPQMPRASPIGEIACPLGAPGPNMSPHLTTPAWPYADHEAAAPATGMSMGGLGGLGGFGGSLSQVDQWAWEMGSEAGSVPSVWSKASTQNSNASSLKSKMSTAAGDGLIPGLIEGQRLSYVKPTSLGAGGGKIVVCLRKQVPQGYWEHIGIVLVNGPTQVRLKPTGIKKGKKLCVEVPPGLKLGDYDVRLSFAQKILHGAIPLAIRDGVDEEVIPEDDEN